MRYRIHYPDDSIYCGPSPASGYHYSVNGVPVSTSDLSVVTGELNDPTIAESDIRNLVKNVYRVQGYYYNIQQGVEPIGGYGTMGPLGYTRSAPTNIEFGFDYLINNFQNEYEFGFCIDTGKNILSDILSKERDGLNFFVKTTQEGSESLHDMSNTNSDVVSFGNCFLNSYSFNYEVNSIPSASAIFSCDNITFTNSITGIRNPAIDPDTDTRYEGFAGIPTGRLYESTGSDYEVSVVRHGDLTLSFEEKRYQGKRLGLEDPSDSYSFLGQKIQDAAIQSFSVSLELNRDSVVQLGSKIVKNRDVIPPAYASVDISAICNNYNTGDYLDSLEENRIYDLSLTARKPSCDPNSRTELLKYDFSQSILSKKDYILNIGTNKIVNYSFQVPIFDDSRFKKGVSFSGLFNTGYSIGSSESVTPEESQDTDFNSLALDTFDDYVDGYYITGENIVSLNAGSGFYRGYNVYENISGRQVWFDSEDYSVQSISENTLSITRGYNTSMTFVPTSFGIKGNESFTSYSANSGYDITGNLNAGTLWTGVWSFLDNPTGSY